MLVIDSDSLSLPLPSTVMYELLSRKFPFMTDIFGYSMDPSVVVYLVCSGRRPDMQSREIPKRVKVCVRERERERHVEGGRRKEGRGRERW